jgi:hypothetical protein
MTNAIFNKLKPHRKYHRKPMCENLGGICTFEKCRCFYPLMEPETKRQIDENLHHREKVIKRRREIELNKLDYLIVTVDGYVGLGGKDACNPSQKLYVGEFAKRRAQIKKFKRMFWKCLLGFIGLVVLYIVFINLFNI